MTHSLPGYAELHCLTQLQLPARRVPSGRTGGASLSNWAIRALAITDECSVAGVVRAYSAWKDLQLGPEDPFKLILGSEFRFDGFRLVALARNTDGWGNLCEFITAARREANKGEYSVSREGSDFGLLAECEILIAPSSARNRMPWRAAMAKNCWRSFPGRKAASATAPGWRWSCRRAWTMRSGCRPAASRRTHRRASGGSRGRAHARAVPQGLAGCDHARCGKERPWANAAWHCSRMPSGTCARG